MNLSILVYYSVSLSCCFKYFVILSFCHVMNSNVYIWKHFEKLFRHQQAKWNNLDGHFMDISLIYLVN